jgi:DNA-binding GntR family transcriptional regulator
MAHMGDFAIATLTCKPELTLNLTASPSSHSRSTSDRVAEAISKRILHRELGVGHRLVEADLMRDFGVSRSTVRESLKILAANGVVDLHHNRGAVIRSLSPHDARDLLQVLEVLSGLGARLAAEKIQHGNNRQRFNAVASPLTLADIPDDFELILNQRARYYQVMFDIAGNKELSQAMPLPRVHLFRTQFYAFLTKGDVKAMIGEYRGISDAILAGDPSKAETKMRRHILRTAERTLPRYLSTGSD